MSDLPNVAAQDSGSVATEDAGAVVRLPRTSRNLVIVRAADSSLHESWLSKNGTQDWDLVVNYFGDKPDRYRGDNVIRGGGELTKWPALYNVIQQISGDLENYDFVWFPDDDLAIDAGSIDRMFALCRELHLDLAQPALTADSYISHPITLVNKSLGVRFTNFVEIMAPVFSTALLRKCLESFRETVSGHGLDYLWPTWVDGVEKIAILDACRMRHTRPIGQGATYKMLAAQGKTPADEVLALFRKYRVTDCTIRVQAAIDTAGRKLSLEAGQGRELIEKVIGGYLPEMTSQALIGVLRPLLQWMAVPPSHKNEIADGEARTRSIQQSAAAYMAEGKPAEATRFLETALVEGENSEIWNDWATAVFVGGDAIRAEWGYRRALQLMQSNRQAAVNLAILLLTQGRLIESIVVLDPQRASLTEDEKQAIQRLTMSVTTPCVGQQMQS